MKHALQTHLVCVRRMPNSVAYTVGSRQFGMRMRTTVPIGEAEGGFETRHYESNLRRDHNQLF